MRGSSGGAAAARQRVFNTSPSPPPLPADKSPDTRSKAVRLVCNQLIQEPQLEAAIVAFAQAALRQLQIKGGQQQQGEEEGWTQEEAAR